MINTLANECLTTPQHKNQLAIGCQTNGICIKSQTANVYIKNSLGYKHSVKSCVKCVYHRYKKLIFMIKLTKQIAH